MIHIYLSILTWNHSILFSLTHDGQKLTVFRSSVHNYANTVPLHLCIYLFSHTSKLCHTLLWALSDNILTPSLAKMHIINQYLIIPFHHLPRASHILINWRFWTWDLHYMINNMMLNAIMFGNQTQVIHNHDMHLSLHFNF